jgi:hypothetical protein
MSHVPSLTCPSLTVGAGLRFEDGLPRADPAGAAGRETDDLDAGCYHDDMVKTDAGAMTTARHRAPAVDFRSGMGKERLELLPAEPALEGDNLAGWSLRRSTRPISDG